ncbi:MAG TPA: hypothetical protein VI455_18800 [Terriglobia bacterium]
MPKKNPFSSGRTTASSSPGTICQADEGMPVAIAKASSRELKLILATVVTSFEKVRYPHPFLFCPLRCQLTCSLGHDNGSHLTKMLTGK